MTLTWRASKYKVHKLLKRYILLELVLLQTNPTTTGSSANQPYHNWFFANQPYDSWLFSKPTLPHLGFFAKQPYHIWFFAHQPYYNWLFANQLYHN